MPGYIARLLGLRRSEVTCPLPLHREMEYNDGRLHNGSKLIAMKYILHPPDIGSILRELGNLAPEPKMTSSPRFVAITAIFVTCLITANIIAVKVVNIFGLILPAAVLIFPLSYIVGDVLTEVYGYSAARRVIWLGFFCNLLAAVAIWIGGLLPAASFWGGQEAYQSILGSTPRILAASFIAYIVGEFANSFVLAKMKIATKGRWLWTRTIGSTLVGQGLDSAVFINIAFLGIIPATGIAFAVVSQWLTKSVYESLATPLTYLVVNYLKRTEGADAFDSDTSFNPLALSK